MLLGLGGGLLVMGAITGSMVLGQHGDLETACGGTSSCPTSQANAVGRYHTVGTLSDVGFIGGGGLAAAGVVYWLTTRPRTPARATSLVEGTW